MKRFFLSVTLCSVLLSAACTTSLPETPAAAEPSLEATTNDLAAIKDPSQKLDKAIELAFDTVYFQFDSSQLTDEARKNLSHIAAALKELPGARVLIEGHADERGSNEYNLALSARRAEVIREFLNESGVSAESLATRAMGEEVPADTASNEEAWAKNRRGEFTRLS